MFQAEDLAQVGLEAVGHPLETEIEIEASPGINIQTPPARIEEDNEIDWRVSAEEPGLHTVRIIVNGESITKTISASQKTLSRMSPIRVQRNFTQELLYPTEAPLKKADPIQSIEVTYALKSMDVFGFHIHWIIAFFVLSIIFGFSFKGVFGVEI